jgi:hypothetical protein
MRPVGRILRSGEEQQRRMIERVHLQPRYIVSMFVNVTVCQYNKNIMKINLN